MEQWKCSACHHEWDGSRQVCDWCEAPGKLLEVKPTFPIRRFVAEMMFNSKTVPINRKPC